MIKCHAKIWIDVVTGINIYEHLWNNLLDSQLHLSNIKVK